MFIPLKEGSFSTYTFVKPLMLKLEAPLILNCWNWQELFCCITFKSFYDIKSFILQNTFKFGKEKKSQETLPGEHRWCLLYGVLCLANVTCAGLRWQVNGHDEFSTCWIPNFTVIYDIMHHRDISALVNSSAMCSSCFIVYTTILTLLGLILSSLLVTLLP